MKASLLTFFALAIYGAFTDPNSEPFAVYNPVVIGFPEVKYNDLCGYNGLDATLEFRRALYAFSTQFFKRLALQCKYHCVSSPMSVWMSLAGMAEGMEGPAQQEMFQVLKLPEDRCQRQQYYQIAASREISGPDMTMFRTRVLAYDESLQLNRFWSNYIRSNCLMETLPVPMKRDPIAAESTMRSLINTRQPIAFSGNSAILDSLDFQGLWTTAFSDAVIEKSPFYNDIGQLIGTVDMMVMKKRVRMAYLPDIKMKILELPMGYNGRYRMMLGYSLGSLQDSIANMKDDVVFDVIGNLRTSRIPIDIAIPRFTMTSEYDYRSLLETMGIKSMWTDDYATRNISEPAVKPSSFLQRVTITMDCAGILANSDALPSFLSASEAFDSETGLDTILGRDFIANKPFAFGLLDSQTNSVLMASIFSRPTTRFLLKK